MSGLRIAATWITQLPLHNTEPTHAT